MFKKLVLQNSELSGVLLPARKELVLNKAIGVHCDEIRGTYSFFKSSNIIVWESSFHSQSKLVVSFLPTNETSCFYLLNYESTNCLNQRIDVNLSINTKFLDNQSSKGSLFWVSSVGVELLIPEDTTISFQLIVIPQKKVISHLEKSVFIEKGTPFVGMKAEAPVFYFSGHIPYLSSLFRNIKKIKGTTVRTNYVIDTLSDYLTLDNELLDNHISFWNFYNMLLIEKLIRKTTPVREPNVKSLGESFNYSHKDVSSLFEMVFGTSIIEYHRGFHMKYALWLIENKNLKIEEVSKLLGFKTHTLFTQVFKRHYSATPTSLKLNFNII